MRWSADLGSIIWGTRDGGTCQDIVARGIIRIRHIITKNDLRTWIIGISSIAEELGDILNVLVAALELVFAAGVVDSDQEGLLPGI